MPRYVKRPPHDPVKAKFINETLGHPRATGESFYVLRKLVEKARGRVEIAMTYRTIAKLAFVSPEIARSCMDSLSAPGGPLVEVIDRSLRSKKRFLFRHHPEFAAYATSLMWDVDIAKDNRILAAELQADWLLAQSPSRINRHDRRDGDCVRYTYVPPDDLLHTS